MIRNWKRSYGEKANDNLTNIFCSLVELQNINVEGRITVVRFIWLRSYSIKLLTFQKHC